MTCGLVMVHALLIPESLRYLMAKGKEQGCAALPIKYRALSFSPFAEAGRANLAQTGTIMISHRHYWSWK